MYYDSPSAYQYPSSPNQGYIVPLNLHNMTNTERRRISEIPIKAKITESNIHAVCVLAPGKRHQISEDILPTPRSVMDGSYHPVKLDILTIIPRAPEHCGQTSMPSIVFSVNGKPGPYLHKLERIALDNSRDAVFDGYGWRRAVLSLDWPGVRPDKQYIACTRESLFYTRQDVAREVAKRVIAFILRGRKPDYGEQIIDSYTRRWDVRAIDPRDVRLLGINYYNKTWVPVLAIDDY